MEKMFRVIITALLFAPSCFGEEAFADFADTEVGKRITKDITTVIDLEDSAQLEGFKNFEIVDDGKIVSFTDGSLEDVVKEVENKLPAIKDKTFNPLKDKSYMRCVKVKEIKNVYLCLFKNRKPMNWAFNGASEYIEGNLFLNHRQEFGNAPVYKYQNTENNNYKFSDLRSIVIGGYNKWSGHDIQGKDWIRFMNDYGKLSLKDKPKSRRGRAAMAIKRKFLYTFIAPKIEKYGENFVVLSAYVSSYDKKPKRYPSIIAHEALHAQFFMDKRIRQAVSAYMAKVQRENPEDIKLFVDEMVKIYFAISEDTYLRDNEWWAMMFDSDPESEKKKGKLKGRHALVPKHHDKMLKFIKNYNGWGLRPMQVKCERDKK